VQFVAYATGLRAGELSSATLGDVLTDAMEITGSGWLATAAGRAELRCRPSRGTRSNSRYCNVACL